jgi:predicted RNase H-like HicB family nuclease
MAVKKVTARIGKTGNNFAACVEELDGFICTASSLQELKTEVKEGIKFHLEGLKEDGDPIPEPFEGEYRVVYKWDVESLLYYYQGIFTRSGLERLTGINQNQIGHYAAGRSKPRPAQIEKIETALRKLGEELREISL